MNIEIAHIGRIERGIDGSDEYLLVTCDKDISPEIVRRELLDAWAWDSNGPGQYFCLNVDVIPHPHVGKYIGIIYHRYDV